MIDQMSTVKLHITGKVQGVWFRASAKEEALSLGVTGKVWNNPDQSVGVIAQGDMDDINVFINWCWRGPGLARVEEVSVEDIDSDITYPSFEIARSG